MSESTDLKYLENEFLPILPLRSVVIFPNSRISFEVSTEAAKLAIRHSQLTDRYMIAVLQRDYYLTKPQAKDLHEIGTLVKMDVVIDEDDGSIRLSCVGLARCHYDRVERLEKRTGEGDKQYYLRAKPELVEAGFAPDVQASTMRETLKKTMLRMFQKIAPQQNEMSREIAWLIENTGDTVRIMDMISTIIDIDLPDKYRLLSTLDADERLTTIVELLHQEMRILEINRDLSRSIDRNLEDKQRKVIIKEQIKALESELGDETDELDQLVEKLKAHKMPDSHKEKVFKEIERLRKMPPGFGDYHILLNWIELVLELPFGEVSTEKISLPKARRILDRDHYGLEKVKERILEYIAVRQQKKKQGEESYKGAILCLCGPPGVGKTSIAKSVAEALGRSYVRMALGGIKDESELRGHRKTYIGAMPGRIISSLAHVGVDNPLFLLDELDKLGSDYRGDPSAALLEILDPEQNNTFRDHYLEFEYDLSKVLFLTTANHIEDIPPALLDRLELIDLPGYTEEEKVQIGKRYLLPKQLEVNGLTSDELSLTDGAMRALITGYTMEAGVRELERQIAKICRKVRVDLAEKRGAFVPHHVTVKNLKSYVGAPDSLYEKVAKEPQVGIATGLAWTSFGGDTLTIEVNHYPGKGQLILTGRLGQVMKESAQAALTYVRSRHEKLGIPEDVFNEHDVHVHVPAGAVPKDGPSAGITLATALASALSERAIKPLLAMTGEVTLRGRVLGIGGLKEKTIAARRAGVTEVLIPRENSHNMEDIPESVKSHLKIRLVDHMDDVLDIALLPRPTVEEGETEREEE